MGMKRLTAHPTWWRRSRPTTVNAVNAAEEWEASHGPYWRRCPQEENPVCILTEDGELLERRVRTQASRFAEVLGSRPRARILLEAATESEWVARGVEGLGHEVIVADPNLAPM